MKTPVKKQIQIKNEQGQTMTEFALVLPVLALILFGVIQFGIAFNNFVHADGRNAGRCAQGGRRQDSRIRPARLSPQSGRPPKRPLSRSDLSVTVSSTWQPTADVSVTATYPYSISLLGMVVKSGRLSSTTTERVE